MSIKEESLRLCLNAAACRELPKPFTEDGKTFWIKAIALVKKRNMTQSYCMVSRRADGMVLYERDFGSMSPIAGLISIHPYVFLDMQRFAPNVEGGALRGAIIRELGLTHEEADALSEEDMELKKIELAIRAQLAADAHFIKAGHVDDFDEVPTDEDGFTEVFADRKAKKDLSGKITAEDGSLEEFSDIVTSDDAKKESARKIKEQKRTTSARAKAKKTTKTK